MPYDFDTVINRQGSDSHKWRKYRNRDVIPLWVADMDFVAPPEITSALHERVSHGVFGYGDATEAFHESVQHFLLRDYGWDVHAEWIIPLPGLVSGLNIAARAATATGEGLLTATPIYPPFLSAGPNAGRQTITVPLTHDGQGAWSWDMAALRQALTPTTSALLLCHPHNPVGRVWNEAELHELMAFAERHQLTVISDEIHCELLLDSTLLHRPYAMLSEEASRHSITLMAPSKTYNIPGLGCSFAIIPNMLLRQRFRRAMAGIVPHVNVLGYVAAIAAYQHGQPWRQALLDYLRQNRDLLLQELQGRHGLLVTRPEATYLAWIDCRSLEQENPVQYFEGHGIGLSDGKDFGMPGFVRLNFGCPRATLETAIQRLKTALA